MNIYFDTEFTGLHKDTTLISLGMVSEDGKKFYAEFTDYDRTQVEDWIKENVINNLWIEKIMSAGYTQYKLNYSIARGNKTLIKLSLIDWLKQFDKVELFSDCSHYDMVLFVDIFGTAFDLPKNVCPVCYDINQDIAKVLDISGSEAFNISREEFSCINGNKHNSLYDAEVIKACYEKIKMVKAGD